MEIAPWKFEASDESAKLSICDQLISFINEMHNLDASVFESINPRHLHDFTEPETRVQQELQSKLYPLLNKSEVDVIEQHYQLLQNIMKDDRYEGPKDDTFIQRVDLYYKRHAIYTLLSSKLGAPMPFNFARKRFRDKFNLHRKINLRKQQQIR